MKGFTAALAIGTMIASAEAVRDWFAEGRAELRRKQVAYDNISNAKAKNIILFVADGNGVATNYGTRLYAGQKIGGYGDEYVLAHERMPWAALCKTYNTNAQTPDSAGTSTAMHTGHKTKASVIGVSEVAIRGDCPSIADTKLTSIAKELSDMGKSVGVVSTARVTHATPAGAYAHSVDRNYEASVPEGCDMYQKDIASQLVDSMVGPNAFIDLALGGGRRNFINETVIDHEGDEGDRVDGRNLISEAKAAGVSVATNTAEFNAIDLGTSTKILGLFESSYLKYEHDRQVEMEDGPSIVEMTKAAIDFLSKNEDGFYLMVEAGRVDHANHAGNLHRTFVDSFAYQQAVSYAMKNTNRKDTLIISTADHSHSIAFNGYCGRGSPVTGLCMGIDPAGEETTGVPLLASDDLPFTVISVGNGPGSIVMPKGVNKIDDVTHMRPNVTQEEAMKPDYIQQANVPLSSETHSGSDVAIYAQGPWAHLFIGTVEQSFIYYVMKAAATGMMP